MTDIKVRLRGDTKNPTPFLKGPGEHGRDFDPLATQLFISDRTCRSSVGGYCDHQENRKSVVGCDHLRCTRKGYHCQPFGLKTFSGLSTSRWADGNAGRDRTHVVLVPTFPILRAGESHTTERRKFRNFSKL